MACWASDPLAEHATHSVQYPPLSSLGAGGVFELRSAGYKTRNQAVSTITAPVLS
jgi:hypothetical protein